MLERAKELYIAYGGNRFFMGHDGVEEEYAGYKVDKDTEKRWAEEYINDFTENARYGKDASNRYRKVAELLRNGMVNDSLERCLYYPLHAKHLDDVTCLFMLDISFRMAETSVKKGLLSRRDIKAYIGGLETFSKEIRSRAENGTLTRSEDYIMLEFSDPEYTIYYLDEIKKKWENLF